MRLFNKLNNWLYKKLIPSWELYDIDRYIIIEERERMKRDIVLGKLVDIILTIIIIGILAAVLIYGIK